MTDFEDLSRRIAGLQRDQLDRALSKEDLDADPFEQFARWLEDALAARPEMPNVMTLATASEDGEPSARIVLLKGFDPSGFVFFTNYDSRKGRDLSANPRAALVFYWPELHRQVVVRGEVNRVPAFESDEYFDSRPYASKLGAWASRQSAVLESREELEERMRVAEEEFSQTAIKRPTYWGGFRLTPLTMEFWQGRSNRLHDRFRYRREEMVWKVERLAP